MLTLPNGQVVNPANVSVTFNNGWAIATSLIAIILAAPSIFSRTFGWRISRFSPGIPLAGLYSFRE